MLSKVLACSIWLVAGSAVAAAGGGTENSAKATRTVKERLSTKAADPQRVDDCKVPAALRDPTRPRPTDCGPSAQQTGDPAGNRNTK